MGRTIGSRLKAGRIICLRGGLGAGKTVLVRGLARAFLEADELLITSPTYVLQHVYRHKSASVFHVDAYRIQGGRQEFEDSGLAEYLRPEQGITCIEWPEQISEALPEHYIDIAIDHEGGDVRKITITAEENLTEGL